jgi:molybdate transport system ATP-binding protein
MAYYRSFKKIMLKVCVEKIRKNFSVNAEINCDAKGAVSIIGDSGAGKTTLLRLIAGLEKPNTGKIEIKDKTLFSSKTKVNIPPHKRKISYVFQEYTLFPHWNIEKNILYTAKDKDFGNELIEHFRISHLRKRKPSKASGGERQRAALAQAIARQPDLLLLDEPFSSLDPKNRKKGCEFLISARDKINCPVVLVTHDHEEASEIGDFVYVMENGRIFNS